MKTKSTLLSLITCAILWISAAPAYSQGDPLDPIIPGEVIIRLDQGFDIADFNAEFGTTTLRSIASRNIHLLQLPANEPDEEAWVDQRELNPPPGWIWGEANYEGQNGEGRTGSFFVADIGGNVGYNDQYPRNQQQLPQVHQITTGAGMLIAVLDTGIDASHPELQSRIMPGGFNFIDNNMNTMDVPDDIDNDGDGLIDESVGHGTFVAGLIAMMAPDAMLLPVKVLNSDGLGDNFIFAQGVFHAIDQGAEVINMSLGSTYSSQALEDAVEEAKDGGIVVVGAMGNRNLDGDEDRAGKEFPALKRSVLGIASLDANDVKSAFSNFNDKCELSAPGSAGIFSTIPETSDGFLYAEWEGTSFATALVSGAAALLMADNPQWPETEFRWAQVKDCLQGSSVDVDDANQPQYAGKLGEGRIDTFAALTCRQDDVFLTGFWINVGTLVAGGLDELDRGRDRNDYLEVLSGPGRSFVEPHVMEIGIEAFTFITNPVTMDITIESHVNKPSARARVFLRDSASGEMVQIHQFAPTMNDRVVSIPIVDPARFVDASGRIEMVVRFHITVRFLAFRFRSFFDEISFDLQ